MNNCYTFNILNETLARKENMQHPRDTHGLQRITQKIFSFGGRGNDSKPMKSAEVYDVVQNSWKTIPNILEE